MIDPHYLVTQVHGMYSVLAHVSSWGANESLSLKKLSLKTVMLLALTRPSRSADLSQLNLQGKVYKPDGVVFIPGTSAKHCRQGKPVNKIFFPSFPHESTLFLLQLSGPMRTALLLTEGRNLGCFCLSLGFFRPLLPVR